MVKVHQITLKGNGSVMEDVFEKIQNGYDFYDNCVIDGEEEGGFREVVVEGHRKAQVAQLYTELQEKYPYLSASLKLDQPIENMVIDACRWKETGHLDVERPPRMEECHCDKELTGGKCEGDE